MLGADGKAITVFVLNGPVVVVFIDGGKVVVPLLDKKTVVSFVIAPKNFKRPCQLINWLH